MNQSENHRIYVPARILKCSPTDELRQAAQRAIEESAFDPTVFDELKPFFFKAEISNNTLDAYFTKMATSSLKNYVDDAKNGVSLLDSHNSRRLGIGQSLSAKYSKDGEVERVIAEFYTVYGIKFNDATYQTSDDFINAIRASIARDVSIGFYHAEFICSVCHVDMWDWEAGCRHWPGDVVELKDPDTGKSQGEVTVYASVVNARLSEVSVVYNGATPGAMILKAERAIKEGELTPERVRMLENRFRIQLPEARRIVVVGEIPKTEKEIEENMDPETQNRTAPPATEQAPPPATPPSVQEPTPDAREVEIQSVRTALNEAGCNQPTILEGVRWLVGETVRLNQELKKVPTVIDEETRRLADDGRAYRNDLIESAIKEGVRAHGADFAQEQYRGILEKSSLDVIKRMSEDWSKIANEKFPAGRKTSDTHEEASKPATNSNIPDAAYAS